MDLDGEALNEDRSDGKRTKGTFFASTSKTQDQNARAG